MTENFEDILLDYKQIFSLDKRNGGTYFGQSKYWEDLGFVILLEPTKFDNGLDVIYEENRGSPL